MAPVAVVGSPDCCRSLPDADPCWHSVGEKEKRDMHFNCNHASFLLSLLTMTCGTAARKRLTRPLLLACWQRRCPWPAHNMRVSLPMSFSCIQMRMVDNFTEKSISKRKIHLAAATQKKPKLSSIPCHAHRPPPPAVFDFTLGPFLVTNFDVAFVLACNLQVKLN